MYQLKKELDLEVVSEEPEMISIRFSSTGPCGGDAGHGGNTTLEILTGGGTYTANILQPRQTFHEGNNLDEATRVVFTGWGDWEMDGVVDAIIRLADELKKHVS